MADSFEKMFKKRAAQARASADPAFTRELDTLEQARAEIKRELADPKLKPMERHKFLELLAKMSGWTGQGRIGDIERASNEDLLDLVETLVLPALWRFNVQGAYDPELLPHCLGCGSSEIENKSRRLCSGCVEKFLRGDEAEPEKFPAIYAHEKGGTFATPP